jgi:hypothetical protein
MADKDLAFGRFRFYTGRVILRPVREYRTGRLAHASGKA